MVATTPAQFTTVTSVTFQNEIVIYIFVNNYNFTYETRELLWLNLNGHMPIVGDFSDDNI